MDAGRFIALYASEARENLELLSRSVLALESPTAANEAVGDAFRAAHTLKGAAAAMGHARVTDLAHAIEDRLEALRAGRAVIESALVDALLAAVDTLRTAVDASLRATPAPSASDQPARARVRLRPETPLVGARALLITMNLRRRSLLSATEPATFDDESFDGTFVVITPPATDRGAVEAAILSSGDVESVVWEDARPNAVGADTPVAHIRVDPRRLDALAESIAELTVLHAREGARRAPAAATTGDRTARVLATLREEIVRLRMLPVAGVFDRLPRAVRDAARVSGREARVRLVGSDIELDRALLDELGDLLLHLVRNAVGHGLERPDEREAAGKPRVGEIEVRAERERGHVRITVRDDGRGIPRANVVQHAIRLGVVPPAHATDIDDDELLRILTHPGFSTAERVTELSGRGVGLDVVAKRLRALGGAFTLSTEPGRGTTFTLLMPLTLAMAQALRVRVCGEDYAIPLTHVAEAIEIQDVMLSAVNGREAVRLRDDLVPLVRLRSVLGLPAAGAETTAVVAALGERRAALAVDELIGREQILIRPYDAARGALPLFSGVTLLADGRAVLVLDPLSVT